MINIRAERPGDYEAILRLTYDAFLTADYPGRQRVDEHFLISLLRGSEFVIPGLCLVAEREGQIIGHILYTKSKILRPDGSETPTITFGPLSVAPECHRQGVGAAMVARSMDMAREQGFGAVLITGVPDYYPKLGFERAREYGLALEDGTSPDYFMAYELLPGYLSGGGVLKFLPPEFEQSEKDDEGYAAFHRKCMAERFPGQTVIRPLFESDIALMRRWLYLPHVAEWYKHPEHWLNELKERRGEFSFLSHFIIEFEGIPIGFCQYYDCFFAQEHEVWSDNLNVGERQGENFSLDYLIGEPEYLRRGHGGQAVRLLSEKIRRLGAKRIIAEPEPENLASCRVLESCGFVRDGAEYVLELNQERNQR